MRRKERPKGWVAMRFGYMACNGLPRGAAPSSDATLQLIQQELAVTTVVVTDRKGCLLALERERDNLGTAKKSLLTVVTRTRYLLRQYRNGWVRR